MWYHGQDTRYQPLTEGESKEVCGTASLPVESTEHKASRLLQLWVTALTIAGSLLLGFLLGRYSVSQPPLTRDGLIVPPGGVPDVWEHNLTFSGKPSPESEAAWASLVPIGRGFIHHPDIAPFISNIAVFHQLHCLHGIRVAYYADLQQLEVLNGSATADPYLEEIGARTDNVHMRHCFDYLRHAIMCAADTNLEAVSQEEHVTTGWGSKRVCRDYSTVKAWAEQWRNSSDTGIRRR